VALSIIVAGKVFWCSRLACLNVNNLEGVANSMSQLPLSFTGFTIGSDTDLATVS